MRTRECQIKKMISVNFKVEIVIDVTKTGSAETKTARSEADTETKTSRLNTKTNTAETKTETAKNRLEISGDRELVSRPTSLETVEAMQYI